MGYAESKLRLDAVHEVSRYRTRAEDLGGDIDLDDQKAS
jgi:hypothetical protein